MQQTGRTKVNTLIRLLIVASTLVASTLVAVGTFTPQPASAHDTCDFTNEEGPGGDSDLGCVFDAHYTVVVQDKNCDGHGVLVIFYVRDVAGSFVHRADGCRAGPKEWNLLSPVTRWMVCTDTVECTPLHRA